MMWIKAIGNFMFSNGNIVILAAAWQPIAYVFSNQVMLRLFLLAGTFLYLAYYFVAVDDPLWPAIIGTGFIGVTSLYGFVRALAHRSKLTISKENCPIFEKMGGIEPGTFRKLMKNARIKTFEDCQFLTTMEKDERFRIAIEALFSKDIAIKLMQAAKVS